MGTVYLAGDRRRNGGLVALKRLRAGRAGRRARVLLAKEFLTLAGLEHPGLPRVHEFEVERESGDPFFTSEFIDGADLLEATAALDLSRRRDLEVFFDLLAQVLRALEFLHARGVVHGDVKPANVLVCPASADAYFSGESRAAGDGRGIKLIDFGLTGRERERCGGKVLATPYYVAPEVIQGSRIDRRADLYSLGAVLYHLATRQPPFAGASNLAVLRNHLHDRPALPQDLLPTLPAALGAIVLRLLEKKPGDRFQHALEVIEAVNRAFGLSLPLETEATAASTLAAGALAGRRDEITRLRHAFTAACRARAGGRKRLPPRRLVVLRGGDTVLRSRLLADLGRWAQSRGAVVLEHGPADGASAPEGDPGSLRRELLSFARLPLETIAPPATVAAACVAESAARPLLLHLRNLRRAAGEDLEIAACLVEAASTWQSPAGRILLTASAGEEETPLEEILLALLGRNLFQEQVRVLELRTLGEREVEAVLAEAFPGLELPAAWVERLDDESDGSLEGLLEVLGAWLREGRIERTPSSWFARSVEDGAPLEPRRRLRRRIARLPEETLRLARAFAVLGTAPLELAAELARVSAVSLPGSLEHLRREGIVRATRRGGGRAYAVCRTAVATTLCQPLRRAERAGLHRRAGELLEKRQRLLGRDDPEELAHHYLRGRDHLKGIHFALEAARKLAREFAPGKAMELYEQALALLGEEAAGAGGESSPCDGPGHAGRSSEDGARDGLIARLHRELAELRFQVGDAMGVLDLLWPLCRSGEADAQRGGRPLLYLQMARAHVRLGDFEEAAILLQKAEEVGARGSGEAGRAAMGPGSAALLFTAAELRHHKGEVEESLCSVDEILEREGEIGSAVLRSEVYLLAAANHALLEELRLARAYARRACRILYLEHDPHLLALRLFARGVRCKLQNRFEQARRQFRLAALLRRKMSAAAAEADCLREGGVLELRLGRLRRARGCLKRAQELYRRSGSFLERLETECALGEVYRLRGEHDLCRNLLGGVLARSTGPGLWRQRAGARLSLAAASLDAGGLADAERLILAARSEWRARVGTGALEARAVLLECRLTAQGGKLEEALEHTASGLRAAHEIGDPLAVLGLLTERASLLLDLGWTDEAREALESLHDLGRRWRLRRARGGAWLGAAVLLGTEGDEDRARHALVRAAAFLKAGGFERDLARYHLESGLLNLRWGSHEQAYIDIEEGFHLARRLDIAYLKCRFALAAGYLEQALGGAETSRAEERFRLAERLAIESPYPLLLAEATAALENAGGAAGPSSGESGADSRLEEAERRGTLPGALSPGHWQGADAPSPVAP
jgi:tetratricopeptide (TPR) repeat protein/tRNA A-37 threonylcarbamoyl transferase component Bud32